jgi:peptidoglycan/LPS O-acetylase OafA/YrhL
MFIWGDDEPQRDSVVATGGYSLLAAFFGAVLAIAVTSPPAGMPGRLFTSRPLTFLGRYSYAIYVFHYPLIFVAPSVAGLVHLSEVPRLLGSQLPALLLYIGAASLVSVCLALVSWHVWEKPFLELKRRFPYDARTGDGPATDALRAPLPSGSGR